MPRVWAWCGPLYDGLDRPVSVARYRCPGLFSGEEAAKGEIFNERVWAAGTFDVEPLAAAAVFVKSTCLCVCRVDEGKHQHAWSAMLAPTCVRKVCGK